MNASEGNMREPIAMQSRTSGIWDGILLPRSVWGVLLLITIVLILQAGVMPHRPVWITDNGNKLLTAMRIAGGYGDTFEPSAVFSGAGDYFPGDFHFHRVGEDGTARSILPVAFPFLAALPQMIFGIDAYLFWPVTGTVLTLLLLGMLLRLLGVPPRANCWCIVLTFLGAPFLFYSATVWEMTLSCVFPVAAFVLLRRKLPVCAGVALGAGLWFREECAVIALLIAAAMFFTGFRSFKSMCVRILLFSLGLLLAGIPLCVYNFVTFGHILGFHGALYYSHNAAYSTPVSPALRLVRGYWMYLFQFDGRADLPYCLELILYIPIVCLPIAGAFRCRKLRLTALCAAAVSYAVFFFVAVSKPGDAITYAGLNTGFITCSPLYAGFFLAWRELLADRRTYIRAGALIAVGYCVMVPPILTQTDIGVIWGARHFILLAPLFTVLSLCGFRRLRLPHFRMRRAVALLAGVAGVFAVFGSYAVISRAHAYESAAAELPEGLIVTDAFFLPEMAPQLSTANVLYVRSDADLLELLGKLRGKAEYFDLVLCSATPAYGFISDGCLEQLNTAPYLHLESVRQITKAADTFMQFSVFHVRLDSY